MEDKQKVIKELNRISMLSDMLFENACVNAEEYSRAGYNLPKNHNQSNTAIKNQIVTLRNELLILSKMYNY